MVHARRGERAAYRPIVTPLSPSADPLDIAAGLLDLAPFRTLYIADLDAILGRGGNGSAIEAVRNRFPGLDLWVDSGARYGGKVVGSEMFAGLEAVAAALGPASILSLDHDADGPLGPPELHERPELWPERVIVMTLARVGGAQGPDFERLEAVLARAGRRRVYAAGGVSSPADLDRLEAMGVAGALLASALHDGRIGREALSHFMPSSGPQAKP